MTRHKQNEVRPEATAYLLSTAVECLRKVEGPSTASQSCQSLLQKVVTLTRRP